MVLILSGFSDEERSIARQVGARSGAGAETLIGLGIQEMAAVISRADLLVSNDSGPMHIGSALGVATLGIFSSSLPEHYRPLGSKDRYIKKDSVVEVQVDEVLEMIGQMEVMDYPGHQP